MGDLDRNLHGIDGLQALAEAPRAEGAAATDAEPPNFFDMLVVNSGGVLSVSIAALGIWKLVELVV